MIHTKPNPYLIPAFHEPIINFNFSTPYGLKNIDVFENFLTNGDCDKLIKLFDDAPEKAPVSIQGLKDVMSGKGSDRTTMWSEELAKMLFDKLAITTFNPNLFTNQFSRTDAWQKVDSLENYWSLEAISPLLRFMSYSENGEHYPHYDAGYIYPNSKIRTLKSFVIYLTTNDSGATRFIRDKQTNILQSERNNDDWSRAANDNEINIKILPSKGTILIFDHRLCHDVAKFTPESEDEKRIIIRGDLIYKLC